MTWSALHKGYILTFGTSAYLFRPLNPPLLDEAMLTLSLRSTWRRMTVFNNKILRRLSCSHCRHGEPDHDKCGVSASP
jgi:hypothetical protein